MSMFSNVSHTATTLLNTVQTGATSLSRTITTVSSTLDMADKFVQTAKEKQHIATKAEMETFVKDTKVNAWKEAARKHAALEKELNADAAFKKAYLSMESNWNKFEDELNQELALMRGKPTTND